MDGYRRYPASGRNRVVFFVDRADDMFVCAGENIYPGDVEAMLERHDEIMQAVVVPAPNTLKAHAIRVDREARGIVARRTGG